MQANPQTEGTQSWEAGAVVQHNETGRWYVVEDATRSVIVVDGGWHHGKEQFTPLLPAPVVIASWAEAGRLIHELCARLNPSSKNRNWIELLRRVEGGESESVYVVFCVLTDGITVGLSAATHDMDAVDKGSNIVRAVQGWTAAVAAHMAPAEGV